MRLLAMLGTIIILTTSISTYAAEDELICGKHSKKLWQIAMCELVVNQNKLTKAYRKERNDILAENNSEADLLISAIWGMSRQGQAVILDWKADHEELIYQFNQHLLEQSLDPIPEQLADELKKASDAADTRIDSYVDAMLPILVPHITKQGQRLLYVDTKSDSYGFIIVHPVKYHRWHNVELEKLVSFTDYSIDAQKRNFGERDVRRLMPRPIAEAKGLAEAE